MGADIYGVKYRFVFGAITQGQFDFIEKNIYCSDDGTYELSAEKYGELERKFKEHDDLKDLLRAFSREIKRGRGHFSFRVFA
jgi:hypothetical protein